MVKEHREVDLQVLKRWENIDCAQGPSRDQAGREASWSWSEERCSHLVRPGVMRLTPMSMSLELVARWQRRFRHLFALGNSGGSSDELVEFEDWKIG